HYYSHPRHQRQKHLRPRRHALLHPYHRRASVHRQPSSGPELYRPRIDLPWRPGWRVSYLPPVQQLDAPVPEHELRCRPGVLRQPQPARLRDVRPARHRRYGPVYWQHSQVQQPIGPGLRLLAVQPVVAPVPDRPVPCWPQVLQQRQQHRRLLQL
ncbi:hypothetical protein GGH95_006617, partial [Coemansia sp. RSA 1836]